MRLTRNISPDGKCKYAIVRLDKLRKVPHHSLLADRAAKALDELAATGLLEYGEIGSEEEFFVLKLKDKYARAAIEEYLTQVSRDAHLSGWTPRSEPDKELVEYAADLEALHDRACARTDRRTPTV